MSTPETLIGSNVQLVTLPDVYFQVRSIVEDPDAGLGQLADVIAHDPGIAARFLRAANSPMFGFAARVDTVSRALTVLGMQQAHDIVLATAVARAFGGISSKIIDMQAFWRRSVFCAIVSRLIAERCDVLDSERLFVEGLLRDLGHLIMYLKIPGKARQAAERSRESGIPVHGAEREVLGFDYAQVGGALMAHWELPRSLQLAIRHHPAPSEAEEFLLETSILHLAAAVTDGEVSQGDLDVSVLAIDAEAWRVTQLSAAEVQAVYKEADEQLVEVVNAFFPRETSHSPPGRAAG